MGQYLFQSPNRYIFHGAEVYSDSEDETSSSCSSDSDGSECSPEEVDDDSEAEDAAEDGETCLKDSLQRTLSNEATSGPQKDSTSEKALSAMDIQV